LPSAIQSRVSRRTRPAMHERAQPGATACVRRRIDRAGHAPLRTPARLI
jgi:hypothetical protein